MLLTCGVPRRGAIRIGRGGRSIMMPTDRLLITKESCCGSEKNVGAFEV